MGLYSNQQISLTAYLQAWPNTRKFVTKLQELLDEQRVPPKNGKNAKSTARVLTSTESLALLIEKEKKKNKGRGAKSKKEGGT